MIARRGDLNCAHPFPRVFGYKRWSGFMEGDIKDVRVYTLHIPHKVRT